MTLNFVLKGSKYGSPSGHKTTNHRTFASVDHYRINLGDIKIF